MNAAELSAFWDSWGGSPSSFREELERRGVQYLSWSRVSTFYRCAACYHRQYVLRRRENPTESQRIGTIFHQLAERLYGPVSSNSASNPVDSDAFKSLSEKGQQAVRNFQQLLPEQMWQREQVLAVEEPMFLELSPSLPPVFGVPDLLVREDAGKILVVDHKTTQTFGDREPGQLALYAEMVRRRYGAEHVEGCFDEYRRVADLSKIRIPAFRRVRVTTSPESFAELTASWRDAWVGMQALQDSRDVDGTDGCWNCKRYYWDNPEDEPEGRGARQSVQETGVLRTRPANETELALLALALDEKRILDLLARGFRTVADVAQAATADVVMVRDGRRMLSRERTRLRCQLEGMREYWSNLDRPRITIPAAFHAKSISSIGLQSRYERALRVFGCETLGNLNGLTETDILTVRGIGDRAFRDLIEKLNEMLSLER